MPALFIPPPWLDTPCLIVKLDTVVVTPALFVKTLLVAEPSSVCAWIMVWDASEVLPVIVTSVVKVISKLTVVISEKVFTPEPKREIVSYAPLNTFCASELS